jgi:hypothetical protein
VQKTLHHGLNFTSRTGGSILKSKCPKERGVVNEKGKEAQNSNDLYLAEDKKFRRI